jgi:hypothetical protein
MGRKETNDTGKKRRLPWWVRLLVWTLRPVARQVLGVEKETRKAGVRARLRGTWRGWMPLAVTFLLLIVGTILGFSANRGKAVFTALLIGAAAGGVLYGRIKYRERQAKQGRGKRMRRRKVIHAGATIAAATIWLVAAACVTVFNPFVLASLWLGWIPPAVIWWIDNRVRPVEKPTEQVAVWEAKVAAPGKVLPASFLIPATFRSEDDGGWAATVDLSESDIPAPDAIRAVPKVALAFKVPVTSVAIEQTAEADSHLVNVSVYPRNPLREVKVWPGPKFDHKAGTATLPRELYDPDTGIATIGTYADRNRVQYWFWRPEMGAVHDLVSGDIRSGKSRTVELLLAIERYVPEFISLVGDPQGGMSLPEWQDNVPWYANSPDECLILLEALQDWVHDRERRLGQMEWVDERGRERKGKQLLEPSVENPLVCSTFEEWTTLIGAFPRAADMGEDIARLAPKCGFKLRLVTQLPLLDQVGSQTLRTQLVSGNIITFRTSTSIGAQVTGLSRQLPVDPVLIPREWPDHSSTGGVGYVLGPGARGSAMRIDRADDIFGLATWGKTKEIEPDAVKVLGDRYTTWRDRRAGTTRTAEEPQRRDTITLAKPAPAEEVPELPGRATKANARILDFLRREAAAHPGRPVSSQTISRTLDIPLPTVSQSLARYRREGLVEQPLRDGKHQPGLWFAVVEGNEREVA